MKETIDGEEGEIPTMPDAFNTVATLGLEVREYVLEYEGVALC